eukprot:3823662-Prymnesium_polylepis.1
MKNATGTDGTAYGVHSTHEFFGHHAAGISIAIVSGEVEAIVQGISKDETRMTGQAETRSAAKCQSAPPLHDRVACGL